jgi:hypothetical protein
MVAALKFRGYLAMGSFNSSSQLSITVNLNAGFQVENINSTYHPITLNNIMNSKQGEVKQIKFGLSGHRGERDFEWV